MSASFVLAAYARALDTCWRSMRSRFPIGQPVCIHLNHQGHSIAHGGKLGTVVNAGWSYGGWPPMQGDLISVRLTEADGGETVLITDEHLYAADVDMHVLERIRTGPERRASELAARMVLQEICLKALPEQEQKHRIESEESEENDESDESDESDDGLVPVRQLPRHETRIWQIGVFTAAECSEILRAVAAAVRRRGWNRQRHYANATTDLPLADLGDTCEAWVRATIFNKLLRPLMPLFMPGSACLPEALHFRDLFVVRYGCLPGEQRELPMHADGSLFSVNILLNDPADFDGGGTYFELTCQRVRPPRGSAIAHSGDLRHCGKPITRGERYLLVGFIGCAYEQPSSAAAGKYYSLENLQHAERDAFIKFGPGAWDRRPCEAPQLISP